MHKTEAIHKALVQAFWARYPALDEYRVYTFDEIYPDLRKDLSKDKFIEFENALFDVVIKSDMPLLPVIPSSPSDPAYYALDHTDYRALAD